MITIGIILCLVIGAVAYCRAHAVLSAPPRYCVRSFLQPDLQTGDIILTHCTSSWLGRLTLRLSGGPCTHEALVYDPNTIVQAMRAIGKLEKVSFTQFVADQLKDRPATEWAVYRPKAPLTAYQVLTIKACLDEELQWDRYSVTELFLQAADDLLARLLRRPRIGLDVLVFRRLGDVWPNGVICSKAANRPDIKAGLLPEIMQYGSPNDTWAFITAPILAAQKDRPAKRKRLTRTTTYLAPSIFKDWTRIAQSENWSWA